MWMYAWQINSPSQRRNRKAPTEVRQLNYQRQNRMQQVPEEWRGLWVQMRVQPPAGITWATGTCCWEPLILMTLSPPHAGLASAFSLRGSETSHPKPELCDKQPIPLDLRSLHNGCFGWESYTPPHGVCPLLIPTTLLQVEETNIWAPQWTIENVLFNQELSIKIQSTIRGERLG